MLKHTVAAIYVACAMPVLAQQATPADLRVGVVTAETQPLSIDLQLSGQIEAIDTVELGFRQGGRVTQVLVEEGNHVSVGQPLARLDAVQQDQALNVAEAGLGAARAGAEQARQARDRAIALLDRGVGTRAAADQAEQALSQAEGALERAESAVDQARRAVDDTVLRAPDDAVVTGKSLAPGQVVAPAQPVLTLAETNGLEAVFNAPDDPVLREILGRKVRLTTLDIQRPDMTGTVTEVSPLVDPESGTVTVRAQFDALQPMAGLLGASIRGHLRLALDEGVVVPWNALMRQGDEAAVWTVDSDRRVSLTPIRIAHFVDGAIYVAEGLSDGQQVVGEGSQLLYPGRRVIPVQEEQP
ncbi:efflux RND transporter periplasmic adaptor subunit [Paracoccus beibuensis]|uniref:efflux RND transporter periplasmic adaptor subunit n=1 Tax=Paracoccus beibuensis TaxID=547602 RepID=UPI00223E93E0|nr:efflux RND transporter periplasmic adaptor subunit [Paracoccus beibuensis]